MAELYFKVHSDWQEVVRLRNEIVHLESKLNQFNGKAPLDVLDKMCDELTAAKARLTELVNAAAIEGSKLDGAFKKNITIDVSTPMGQLKAFDDELQKMSSNLNAYFDTLKGKLVDMVSVLGDGKTIADNIKVNEENLAKIDELNRLNAELREQIKQIQQELDRQQAAWQQVQNTISGNKQAIDGLTQSQHQQAQASAESVAKMNAAIDEEARKNEAAKKSWEDKKAEIESLQAELQKYQAAYDRVMQLKPEDGRLKRWWRETQFASAANNGEVDNATIQHVVGLNSKIEELKQRIKDAQKEEKALSDQFASSSRRVDELRDSVDSTLSPLRQMQQAEDAASKALRLDSARAMLRGITQEMDEAIDKMRTLEGDAERYRDYISKLENGDTSVLNNGQDAATELANARAELEKCEAELEKQKKEYNDLAKYQEQYKQQIVDASGHQMRMRTQIMQTREEMMKMIAEGKAGTPEFQQLSEKAGEMRKQMVLANATMEYFANPSRHLEGLKSALQGVAGSASLVTGIMGVFNTNSEKMAEIQTKIQSYLGVIIGLESAYAAVKKTSNAMLLISEVRSLALAKAKTYETVATNAGTIATMKAAAAQAFFNTVAKMNPYLLLVSGIGLLCGAIWGLTKVLKSESEEEKRLQKEREARIKEAREAHERWANDVASSAGKQIASYENLRRKWKELGNDLTAKKKFIDDNKDAFHDLGWAVNNVADAENLFTKNTQAVINAMLARAKAAAYQTAIADEYAKSIKKRDQIDNTVAGGGYRRVYKEGDRLTNDQIKALNQQYGVNLSATSLDPRTQIKGVSFSTDSKLTAASAAYLTSLEAKDATKRWKANVDALNKETEERVGYLTKGLEQAVKQQEQAVKAVGVQEWQGGGKRGNNKKGNSPDDIVQRQLLQQQEAARIQHQNQLLQEQAVIDQMDDGAEKELAQMRLNHKKRMAELDNEQQDILNKKIEAASKDKKGNTINGFYTSGQYRNVQLTADDMLGVNSKRISESEAYFDNLISVFKKIESGADAPMKKMELLESAYKEIASAASDMGDGDAAKKFVEEAERQYREGLQNINQQRLESLYDYLREFGTIQEQIYAIEKQYNDKIAVEKDDNIKKQLQKKKEAAMAGLNAQNLAMNIDWSTAFSGVGNVLKDIAKETLAQVEKYMQKPEFKSLSATDKKSYVDLRDKLRNETGVGATSPFNFKIWGTIEQNVRDYQESVKKLKAAQEAHNAAIQDMKDADAQYTEAVKSGSDDMIKAAKDVLDAAQDAVNVTEADQGNAQAEADKAKQTLTDNTNAAAKGIQNFTNYLNEMSNGSLYGFANGITKLITSLGKGSDGVGKALGELGGKIGGIVGAILQILDALGDDPAQFIQDLLDKVANVVDKLLSTLLSEVVPAILEGVVNIIGSVIEGVGNMITFGGLGSIFGNHEQEYKDGLKSWEQKIAANTYAVEQLTKSMTDKSKTPQDAQKERDAALSALQGQISSLRGTAHYVADDSSSNIFSGYHSWYWKRNDEGFDYNRFNEVLAQHGSDTRVNEAYDVVNRLSAKDIQILRTYAGDAWADYFGYVDSERDPNEVKKYLEEIGDLAEKDKEIMDDWYASLTNMTFESLRDNFKSMLKDLSKDRDSFLSDFSDKMMDSLLDTMMSTSGLSQRLKEWQTKWGDYIASGNELSTEEVTALREEYQKLIDEGLAMRDEAARVTGYDEYQNTKQEADKKGFAGMSQDLGEEMNGRFTAVQIAGENISAQMNVAVPILTGIGVSMSRTAEMVDGIGRVADDMLTNIVECYTELNLIRINTDDMYKIMKENKGTLEKIEKNTKSL